MVVVVVVVVKKQEACRCWGSERCLAYCSQRQWSERVVVACLARNSTVNEAPLATGTARMIHSGYTKWSVNNGYLNGYFAERGLLV